MTLLFYGDCHGSTPLTMTEIRGMYGCVAAISDRGRLERVNRDRRSQQRPRWRSGYA